MEGNCTNVARDEGTGELKGVCVKDRERIKEKVQGEESKMKKEGIEKRCDWVSVQWKGEKSVDTCLVIS